MLYLLKNEIMCDVTFQVGSQKKPIKAHKFMLSSRSHVFYTMFECSLPETGVISIPDIDESTFHSFLQYIYSDNQNISNNNVKELLYVSDKYMITRLKKECEKVLQESASTSDAAKSLQTAYEYKLDNLLNQSFTYIENNTRYCLLSSHALKLSKECVELILKSENLTCTETELCSFFLQWTRNQCDLAKVSANGQNMRTMAGHLLFLIRFPLVDPKIFAKEVSAIGLLTLSETLSIYQFNFGITVENFPFSNKVRNPSVHRESYTVTRFEQINYGWKSHCVEALQFTANKDIWLNGVVIGSLANTNQTDLGQYNYTRIKVYGNPYYQELYSFQTSVQCYLLSKSDHPKTTEVKFPKPLKILKSTKYTITIQGLPFQSYYGIRCKKLVSVRDVTFTFEKSPNFTTETDENRGQIAGLVVSINEPVGRFDWNYRLIYV